MTFLDGLRLSMRDSRNQRSVGWRTGARGRITTWRTWSPGVLRCGDILSLIENSMFYRFCIFSWPQIANGDIGKGNLSRGDAHVNGSSRRAHEVAPSATWHVPGGVEYFNGHNLDKCWWIRTKLGSVMYVNTPDITAAIFVAMRHIRRKGPFSAPCATLTRIKAYQTWYRFKSQPSDPQRLPKALPRAYVQL